MSFDKGKVGKTFYSHRGKVARVISGIQSKQQQKRTPCVMSVCFVGSNGPGLGERVRDCLACSLASRELRASSLAVLALFLEGGKVPILSHCGARGQGRVQAFICPPFYC